MSSKKSKKKKHKKEERVSSHSAYEDERKRRDTKRFSSPKSHKHYHRHERFSSDKGEARRRRTASPQSSRNVSPSRARLKKTDMGHQRRKEEGFSESKSAGNFRKVESPVTQKKETVTARRKHEDATSSISGRSFSRHDETSQPSFKELEGQKQKLVSRRSAPEKPKSAQDDSPPQELQEKRRKLMKRSLSPELHDDAKRRDVKELPSSNSHQDSPSEVLKEMRKQLLSRRSKEMNQAGGAKSSSQTVKDKFKEIFPVVKPVDSATKQKQPVDFSHKQGDKRPSSGPVPKICFRIPKKISIIKAQTSTDVRNVRLGSSDSRTQCNSQACVPDPVVARSPSTNTLLLSQQREQENQKVLGQTSNKLSSNCSSHPLHVSSADQQVQTCKPTDVTSQSDTSCREDKSPRGSAEIFDSDHEMQLVEELHLARSERRLEVNLAENCGELTCMDIDPPEEGSSMMFNEGQCKQSLLIVLDTNVLISHLDFVKKIRSNGLGALGFPTLLIPWVVLQELDYLKSGKLSSKVEDKARPAVHYIYSCLKNQEPRLMGQSMQQACQTICGAGVANNDDRVLECCLQFQALYPEGAVVLCTDDKNLCSKALLSGVKAFSKADLEKAVNENKPSILNHLRAQPAAAPPVGRAVKVKEKSQERRRNSTAEAPQLSECVSVLESCLQGALSEVLEEEMKAAYADLWTEIVYVKPPWSLESVLKCFRKHWIAVFGNIIKRNLLGCVETLSDCLCSNRSIERATVLRAVRGAVELLSALAGRSQYSGRVDQALSTLHMLQQRLQSQKAPVVSDDEDEDSLMAEIEEGDTPPPHGSHEEVWALFEIIWNNVCQISSALFSVLNYNPGSTEPSPRSTSPPPQEALSCLHKLSTELKQLLVALQRLLSADGSVQDAQTLLSFMHTSEIAAVQTRFSAGDLFDCVSQQEYREKLCVGGAQLSELSVNLDRCAAALSTWP